MFHSSLVSAIQIDNYLITKPEAQGSQLSRCPPLNQRLISLLNSLKPSNIFDKKFRYLLKILRTISRGRWFVLQSPSSIIKFLTGMYTDTNWSGDSSFIDGRWLQKEPSRSTSNISHKRSIKYDWCKGAIHCINPLIA